MALSEQMQSALNDQITCELSASLAYLQMSAYFEEDDRPGMASWMSTQSDEEASHARMFLDFVLARGGGVEIGAISAPLNKFDSPLHVFEEALRHEEMVTARIRIGWPPSSMIWKACPSCTGSCRNRSRKRTWSEGFASGFDGLRTAKWAWL